MGVDIWCARTSRDLTKRVIAVAAEHLRDMTRQHGKLVIGVAGGRYKLEAIRGALLGRLCNVLITDEEVAQALVHKSRVRSLH